MPIPAKQASPPSPVELEGLVQAVGGGSITVNAQVVTVTEDTVIRHGNRRYELADVNVGDRVHVRASRVASTTGTGVQAAVTLEATEILLQNLEGEGGFGEVDALVSVTAVDASASEDATNTGTFRLQRTGNPGQMNHSLTVTYTLTGTAVNGTDYQLLYNAPDLVDS